MGNQVLTVREEFQPLRSVKDFREPEGKITKVSCHSETFVV